MKQSHYFGLDALRALAIGLVVLSHGDDFLPELKAAWGTDTFWAFGVIGVELFYGLSGFLIGSLLLDITHKDGATQPASAGAIGRFILRRWLRTLPLYFLALFSLWHWPQLDPASVGSPISYLTLTQNLWRPMPGPFFGSSWSLVIEEWSYLALAVLVFGFSRFLRWPVVAAAGALIMTAVALRLGLSDLAPGNWDLGIRKIGLIRIDALGYGILAAAALRAAPKGVKLGSYFLAPLCLAGIGYSGWLVASGGLPWLDGFYGRQLFFPILGCAIAGLTPALTSWRSMPVFGQTVRFIARISYTVYLIHVAIKHTVNDMGGGEKFAVYVSLVVIIGALLSYEIEQPIMRLRPRQFPKAREVTTTS